MIHPLFPFFPSLQISEGLQEGVLQSGSLKSQVPHHALALYQQQITMVHESAHEDSAQSKQLQLQQAEKEPPLSSSPRAQSRSPAVVDKEGVWVFGVRGGSGHRSAGEGGD